MQFKILALVSVAGLAAAQSTQSLVQALNGTSDLSNLTSIIASQPQLVASLAGMTNITLLAPNNAAVSAFLNMSTMNGSGPSNEMVQAILSYHVLQGIYQNFSANAMFIPTGLMAKQYTNVTGGQVVEVRNTTVYSGLRDNSTIVQQSINFTGGVIHVIDKVLTVPMSPSDTATEFGLSSFYGALNASGQIGTIDGLSDVTIFVPNNAAFQAIGSALPNLTTQQVLSILAYHVINGTVAYSSTLMNMSVPTLQGNNVTITVVNASTVFVNNARVIIPDVLVSNGVIHVIDEVLNPMNATAASGNSTAGSPAFSGASSVTEAPYTSGQPMPTSTRNTAAVASSATGTASSSAGAWAPKVTGAMGAAALGGLALLMQL